MSKLQNVGLVIIFLTSILLLSPLALLHAQSTGTLSTQTLFAGQVASPTDGGQIRGKVTSAATGNPLADVNIGVYDATGAGVIGAATDSSGTYTVTDLAPGNYK